MNTGKVTLVSICISVFVLALAGVQVRAQIASAQEFSGRATGVNSVITTNGVVSNAATGDTCPLPARGGTSTVTTSGVFIPGTIRTGTITSTTSGSGITSQSSSSVNDFLFVGGGWTIQAASINTATQCNCCDVANPACSASSSVNGLVVTDPTGANFPVTINGTANQVVTLSGGAGTLTFNERTSSAGSITVNGLHINITSGTTNYNVVVASSHSNILCPSLVITAADVNISGHVTDQSGNAIAKATVYITDSTGAVVRTATSGLDGSYTLTSIQVGQTYVVGASAKGWSFAARTINLTDETTGFDLVGTPRL